MTVALPDPYIVRPDGAADAPGVQRNFDALALALSAGGASSSGAPYAHVTNSVAFSVPNGGGGTMIPFDTERADTEGIHDPAANTRLTCRTAGVYLIWGTALWAFNATGAREITIMRNGTTPVGDASIDVFGDTTSLSQQVLGVASLGVGDYVELRAFQNSGGPLNISKGTEWSPEFVMVKVDTIGVVTAAVYTLATLPAAASFPDGRIVAVSNGAAGQQARMALGGAWINLG